MITISLCMIVKNEEAVLARCLDCASQFVDEVVVVDTGSTDRTMEIAGEYTFKVYSYPWNDDFSAARNFSFSKATMEYIMWLDADDVVDPTNILKLRALKEEMDPSVDVAMLQYHVAFDSRGNPTFTYYRERLLRRDRGFYWKEPVHEHVVIWGNTKSYPIAITHGEKARKHSTRNLDIYQKQVDAGVELSPRATYYYARELFTHRRLEEAAARYRKFLSQPDIWVEDAISAAEGLSDCLVGLGQPDAALDVLFASFTRDLPRASILCRVGSIYANKDQIKRAIFWYRFALEVPRPEGWGFVSEDYLSFLPHLELCWLCYRTGDREEAFRHHQACELLKPDHPSVVYNRQFFDNSSQEDEPTDS